MNRILGLILVLCFSPFIYGQPEKAEKEWKEGKEYYIHFVQGGNTIYGLTTLYKVSAEELVAANPEVVTGLKVGQKLLIPVQAGDVIIQPSENTHTVQKSETLYGISKMYGITMEEIIRLNPTTENGINLGQVLNLPAKLPKVNPNTISTAPKTKVVFSDSTINHTVLDHETLYSISKRFMVPVEDLQALNGLRNTKIKPGDVLKIPLKKEKITSVEVRKIEPVKNQKIDPEIIFKKKDAYSIVVLLPFNLDKNADAVTGIATEFLMGAQLALDSLEKLGLNAHVQVLDCPSDTVKLKALLNQKNFKDVDLIFGPFMGAILEVTARWCLKNEVRMVNPLLAQTDVLKNNKFVYNAVTSDISLQQSQAKYIAKNHSKDQLILVKVGSRDDDI
jgi:LysM repeat protein